MRRSPLALMLTAVFALSACGGGGGTSSGNTFEEPVTGIVMKGPVEGATVTLYRFNPANDGTRDSNASTGESFFTDSSPNDALPGAWRSGAIDPFTPFIIAAKGGNYTDEATGETVNLGGRELLGFKPRFGNPAISITPFTHALLLQAKAQMRGSNSAPADALKQVLTAATDSFGFHAIETQPRDPLSPPSGMSLSQQKYTALLGGLSRLLDPATNLDLAAFNTNAFLSNPDNRFELVLAFAKDLADGNLDGAGINANGDIENPIRINDGTGNGVFINFPALTTNANGIDVLFNSTYNFAQNSANLSAVNATSFPIKALRFNNAGGDFLPTVSPNNGDRLHPLITWNGDAVAISVRRASNTNFNARVAWSIGVNSGSFTSPTAYFSVPQGAFLRRQGMTNNGLGEPDLEAGVTYQLTVVLDDNTTGTVNYTP